MIDVVIIIMLIMLVGMVYCFSAIYDILKSIRKEIRDLRYSMVAEFEAILVEEKTGPAIGITVGDIVDESIPIKYCPMFGRKLVK